MASLGEQLRKARESKNISLEEASNDVKISKRYLEALEEGNYSILPAQAYVKGFLQNYARYLGLDPKSALIQYSKLVLPEDEEVENTVPKRTTHRRIARKRVIMLLSVLVFALCCLVALMWWYSQQL